jgi:hypothetical protein
MNICHIKSRGFISYGIRVGSGLNPIYSPEILFFQRCLSWYTRVAMHLWALHIRIKDLLNNPVPPFKRHWKAKDIVIVWKVVR